MNLQDLLGLRLALDTNNPDLFHGNWEDALSEVVAELIEHKEGLEDLAHAKDEFEDSIIETFKNCECTFNEEAEGYKITSIIEHEPCTLTLPHDDLIAGRDYEIIVRVKS